MRKQRCTRGLQRGVGRIFSDGRRDGIERVVPVAGPGEEGGGLARVGRGQLCGQIGRRRNVFDHAIGDDVFRAILRIGHQRDAPFIDDLRLQLHLVVGQLHCVNASCGRAGGLEHQQRLRFFRLREGDFASRLRRFRLIPVKRGLLLRSERNLVGNENLDGHAVAGPAARTSAHANGQNAAADIRRMINGHRTDGHGRCRWRRVSRLGGSEIRRKENRKAE